MLFTLLLLPTRMVVQTDYDTSVTLSALAGNPEGYKGETYANLFDGKKEPNNFSKWCCKFNGSAYVFFKASKAGVPVGYTITTGNDNANFGCGGRNPLSWKLYGNNEGEEGEWVLIQAVENDTKLQDKNYTSYDFPCEGSTSYKYFKWEITAIHSGGTLQVGEFELKLKTCSHKNADNSDALGEVINTVEPTCTEHGYTTHKCSLCNSIVKVYKDDELKPHTLTPHAQKAATCTEAGNMEYWQCSVCNKLFSDEATTKEITDAASLVIPAKGHTFDSEGNCTVCHYKDFRYALFNLDGITNVTITDNGDYPWQMLDLKADGMSNVSSYFTEGNTGLMSSNYGVDDSNSEIEVKFNVEKPILFSFKYLISAKDPNYVIITLNGKPLDDINGTEQKVYKSILNKGEYTLTLSYNTFPGDEGNKGADRAFIYDLNTATTISDYVAELDAMNTTLTFKKITSDNLESIDLSRLVIVNDKPMVKDMYDVETKNIKNIVFDESFKTYAPTSLENFFAGCSTLETISGLEYLNTEKVTDMSGMFDGCQKLSSLDLSKFNTANVTNMSYMFYYCQNLSKLDVSNFNTEKLLTMYCMFQNCKNLTSLDLSNFNTKSVEEMAQMFYGCSTLQNIYVSENFVTGQVYAGYSMFYGCTKLKGFIEYNKNTDTDKNNSKFANYTTGYFTKLVGKNGEEKIGAVGETLTAESLALDDDKDFVAYEPFTATTATYNRTMKEGTTWATLCLPFEVSLAGKNFRAFELLSADEATNTVELEEIETSIAAGTPVIIKMNEGQTKLNFSVADKEIAHEVVSAADGDYQLLGIYTQKVFNKEADNNCYIVKGNKLMNPAKLLENINVTKVASKPFRAYMVDKSSATAGAKMFSIGISDSTTAIDSLNTIANDKAEYYDLQGKRLNEPQKGINIVKRGGKTMKVIIK